jgi:predicted TIM-barrel fold metal-dependent hydrolase
MADDVIDAHIHFGAPRDEESGCFWSEKFTRTAAFFAMKLITGSLFRKMDIHKIKKHMFQVVEKSDFVKRSVFLAMDQVHDEHGNPQPESTHLYVPNRYIRDLARENQRILFGASVHPYRRDWQAELDFCLENRAVLCKWIPSSMGINPEHPQCLPFYRKLADHRLPLLCHGGPEYAIPDTDSRFVRYNNPKYLRTALDEGVTVIIAHCALPYFGLLDIDYQDEFDEFIRLFNESDRNNWRLYADLSAICIPTKSPYIKRLKDNVPDERLIFGSDYPIPISELSYHESPNFFQWVKYAIKVILEKNLLDKNYLIIEGMDFDPCIFTNAARLFAQIRY